jgi:hypothetical protein
MHVVGLQLTKDNEFPHDLQSGAFAAQPYMRSGI